jgi:hypothetical protein
MKQLLGGIRMHCGTELIDSFNSVSDRVTHRSPMIFAIPTPDDVAL